MQKLPFAGAGLNWQDRLNFSRMRQERLAKAQAAMKKHGLAACLLCRPDNVVYVTGVRGPGFVPQLRYALAFTEDAPILYEEGPTLEHNRLNCSWIKPENWRFSYTWLGGAIGQGATRYESKKWAEGIKNDLVEKGLDKEKLGVDMLDEAGRVALQEAGIVVAPAMPAMAEARRIKTEDEINCVRMACAICDVAWYKIYEALKPGVRESEVIAVGMEALYKAGAERVDAVAVRSGPNCFPVLHLVGSDRIIQVGDTVIIDLPGITFMGYHTCYYRTFMVGRKPTDKEKDWHKRCHEYLYAVIDAIKPGATTADAARNFPSAKLWGHEAEEEVGLDHVSHGLGLSLYEEPIAHRAFSFEHPQTYEKGMVMAVETAFGEPFVGGSRLEEDLVVTETGYEILTRMPVEKMIVAGEL
ncbi:M24 family metallopeptidase [Chloroflexota bacterium]